MRKPIIREAEIFALGCTAILVGIWGLCLSGANCRAHGENITSHPGPFIPPLPAKTSPHGAVQDTDFGQALLCSAVPLRRPDPEQEPERSLEIIQSSSLHI